MRQRHILVVDDEPGIRQSLSGVLEDEGYLVEAVESGEACLAALPGSEFELALLDIWLPGMDGMDVLARIQEMPLSERPVVVVISGHGSIEAAVKATKLGAFDFLEKPLSIEKVSVVVKNALEHRSLAIDEARAREIGGEVEARPLGRHGPAPAHHAVGRARRARQGEVREIEAHRVALNRGAPRGVPHHGRRVLDRHREVADVDLDAGRVGVRRAQPRQVHLDAGELPHAQSPAVRALPQHEPWNRHLESSTARALPGSEKRRQVSVACPIAR